jgi:hypothetical protein
LLRLVEFLVQTLAESPREAELPGEGSNFLPAIRSAMDNGLSAFETWDRLSSALEAYRAAVRLGFDGALEHSLPADRRWDMRLWLKDGIARAEKLAGDLPPAYLMHSVKSFERTGQTDAQGRPLIRVTAFDPAAQPPFPEGPVHRMRTLSAKDAADLHGRLRRSSLFDQKLGMCRG